MPSKKNTKKSTARKPSAAKRLVTKAAVPGTRAMPALDGSRFALYVYWIIILFFVSATCYILGRSYSIINPRNVEITEAAMLDVSGMTDEQRASIAEEYSIAGKGKLLSGNATGAILDLSVALEADPNMVIAYVFRGEAHMQVSDYSRAMTDLNAAIEIDPDNSIAYYDRAMLYMRLENSENALMDLNSALEADARKPSDILTTRDIYAKRAQLLLWAKQWQIAANDYTAAINASMNDQNPDDYAGRAEAYTALSEFHKAAADYMSAITLISENIKNVETAAEREQMSRDALAYFEKSAALHVKTGEMDIAKTDLEAAHTLAAALGDDDTAARLEGLINGL